MDESVSLSRRGLLTAAMAVGAGLTGVVGSGVPASAGASAPAGRRGVATRSVGGFDVLALVDASGPFPATVDVAFPDATDADLAAARRVDPAAFGPDGAWNLDFRAYAIRRPGGRVTLVDVGIGPADSPAAPWAPVPGHLPEVLASAGIDVRDVDTVVLTHIHEDHVGWSVNPDGTPRFPRADYVVQRAEVAALTDPVLVGYVVDPLRRAGRLREVDGTVRLCADRRGDTITAVATPGHTPGHQSVVVAGGRGRDVVITGDVLVHAVQLVNPGVGYLFEADADLARATRTDLLRRAHARHATLATAHLRRPFVPA